MIRWLLRLVGCCSHPAEGLIRELRGTVLHFVCECGKSWPAITRTPQDYKRMKALAKRLEQSKRTPATVVQMPRRRAGRSQ